MFNTNVLKGREQIVDFRRLEELVRLCGGSVKGNTVLLPFNAPSHLILEAKKYGYEIEYELDS